MRLLTIFSPFNWMITNYSGIRALLAIFERFTFSRILKSKKKKMWAASRRGQVDPVKLVSSDIISGFFYFSIYSYVLYRVAYKLTQPWKQRPISKQFNLILHCEFFVVSTSQRSPENNLNVNMRMLPDRQLTLSQLTDTFVQCFQIKLLSHFSFF